MGRLYFNGEIMTLNARDEIAEALLTEGEEIMYVGSLEDALSLAAPDTEVADLGGRVLLSSSAYRLLPGLGQIASDYTEVPALLRTLGGQPLEWGTPAEFVILSGRLLGCPPSRLCELEANGEPLCHKKPLASSELVRR